MERFSFKLLHSRDLNARIKAQYLFDYLKVTPTDPKNLKLILSFLYHNSFLKVLFPKSILKKIKGQLKALKHYPLSAKRPYIVVYSMGKVGSSTVYATLKKHFLSTDVDHVHFLSDSYLKEKLPGSNHTHHIDHGFEVRDKINAAIKAGRPVKLISIVREPIKREISNFFQNSFDFIQGELSDYSNEALFLEFEKKVNFNYILNWFDEEFKPFTTIDIYTQPFDHDKGFTVIRDANFEVLLLRLEDLNRIFSKAFETFLEKKITSLEMANESQKKKGVADSLRFIKNKFRLQKEMVDTVYASKYMTHFYRDDEIEHFEEKWLVEA